MKTRKAKPEEKYKRKGITYLWWFLLGGIGAHRLYLGHWKYALCIAAYSIGTLLFSELILSQYMSLDYNVVENFDLITTVILFGFLIYEAFQIPRLILENNGEETDMIVETFK